MIKQRLKNYDDDKDVVVLFSLFSPIYIINHHFKQTYN